MNEKAVSEDDRLLNYTQIHENLTVQQLLNSQSGEIGGIEDGKMTKAFFRNFLRLEQCCCIINVIALGLSVIEYDLEFDERDEEIAMVLLWAIIASTCVSIMLTIWRYQSYLNYLQVRKEISKKDTLLSDDSWIYLSVEVLLLTIIPNPFTWNIRIYFYNDVQSSEGYYHVNEVLGLIMLLRVIFVVRTILIETIWYSNRTQRVCNLYACEANYMFVIKSLMRLLLYQPYTVIFSTMALMIAVFGYAVRICESPLARNDPTTNNLSLYSNTMWNMIITMTTVGYGDFYARTDLGRLVIFVVCISGVLVVSLMVVTLNISLTTSSLEGKAITVLERLQIREQMIKLAAQVITLMAKTSIRWKKGTISEKQHQHELIRLRRVMNEFKIILRRYKSITDTSSINEEMGREFDILRSHFNDLMDRQNQLVTINQAILGKVRGDSKILTNNQLKEKTLNFQNSEEAMTSR